MIGELARRRTEAWAELLAQALPDGIGQDAPRPADPGATVGRRPRTARPTGRASAASLRHASAPGTRQCWVECLDELLAAADRVGALA